MTTCPVIFDQLPNRKQRAEPAKGMAWADVAAVAGLAGIGIIVSLLIAELAFPGDPARLDHVRAGVLVGSVLAAVIAGVQLKLRDRWSVAAASALDAGPVGGALTGPA